MNDYSSPPQARATEVFSYEEGRERILKAVLQVSCVLGFIAIALSLFGPASLLDKVIALTGYCILVSIALLNQFPYRIRAGLFLGLFYLAGLSFLFDRGLAHAAILLLGFVVLAGLLFSSRAGLYLMILLAVLTMWIVGGANTPFVENAKITALLAIISAIIAAGLHRFQQEFAKIRSTAHQALDAVREEQASLEQRVEARTAGLVRKTEQFRATSYVARRIAEAQDFASLLETATGLITEQFGFYHTGIFLLNQSGNQAVLQSSSSEGGQRMIERGHSVPVGSPTLVGYVAAQKKPRIGLDIGPDAVLFNNPDLPLTRSEIAVPLVIRNKVLGVLDIQSDKPQAFSVDDIDVLETLSDQIAIAIESTLLLEEAQAAITQLQEVSGIRTEEAWSQKLQDQDRVFTYTPLGLRAEKRSETTANAIAAPIVLRGRKIGNISIARKGDARWSRLDEDLIAEVASQVGLAVDNIRLLEDATQRAQQEQAVGRLATHFSQSLDLDTLLQTAARELGQLPDVSEVSVFIEKQAEQISSPQRPSNRNII